MNDPREILARIRKQADAATEGPWEHEPPPGPGEDPMRPICVYPKEDGGTLAYVQPLEADAEFIAAARTTLPALLDALEKVLELHRPVDEEAIPWDCAEGDCDHEDDEHPLVTLTLCEECYRIATEVDSWYGERGCSAVLWPCPTVTAITTALEATK